MAIDAEVEESWYCVRCVFRSTRGGTTSYEERLTLWRADSFETAVERAESEALAYANDIDAEYADLCQAYHLDTSRAPGEGDEIFSLIRASDLEPDAYLGQFFDTGQERQGTIP